MEFTKPLCYNAEDLFYTIMIVVTGAAGFIGSNIAERLSREGRRVIGIDNFDPFYPRCFKEFNLEQVRAADEQRKFTFIEIDLLDGIKIGNLMRELKPDLVIHCAARAGVRPSVQQPNDYVRINVNGSQNLLEAARLHSPKTRFILLSSSSVYGLQKKTPFRESMRANPQSPYGASKYMMETIARQYSIFYDLHITVIRPFSIYGPRGRLDMAPFLVIRAAESGEPFTQFGSNQDNMRDWTYIDDFVEGVYCFVDNKHEQPFELFNFGNSNPVGIDDFLGLHAKLLKKHFNITLNLVRRERSKEELPITFADISKAAKYGYKPKVQYADGLERMYHFYRQHRKRYLREWFG